MHHKIGIRRDRITSMHVVGMMHNNNDNHMLYRQCASDFVIHALVGQEQRHHKSAPSERQT